MFLSPLHHNLKAFHQNFEFWCSQQTASVNYELCLALKLIRLHLNLTSAICEARIARLEQFALGLNDTDAVNTAIPRAESELAASLASLRMDWSSVSQRPAQLNTRITAAYLEFPDFVSHPTYYQKRN